MGLMKIGQELAYKHYSKPGREDVHLLMHGGNDGLESPFISRMFEAVAGEQRSVFAFNLPYRERGDKSSSENLEEEVGALGSVLEYLRSEGCAEINIIAKSLGAVVTSFYLEKAPAADVGVTVLGYVVGGVKTAALTPNLKLVIQGAKDRFGDAEAVRREIGGSPAEIIEIPQADHSYRNEAGNPEYQPDVISLLVKRLGA